MRLDTNARTTSILTYELGQSDLTGNLAAFIGADVDFLNQQCNPHHDNRTTERRSDATKSLRRVCDANDREQDAQPTNPGRETVSRSRNHTYTSAPDRGHTP